MTLSPLDRIRLAKSFVAIVRNPRNLADVLEMSDRIADGELDEWRRRVRGRLRIERR